MKEKCIIFDMDGTLIDSSAAMTQSVNFVRDSIGLAPIGKKELEYHINQPDQHLPMIFYGTDEYDPNHRALFKEHYMQSSITSVLYPGVKEMLHELNAKAHLCIATNASDFFARRMLEALHVAEYFSAIVGGNNVLEPKPSPLMVQYLMREVDAKPNDTLLIGDSVKDEGAAKNAGIDFIFAEWGYGTAQEASLRVRNVPELLRLLKTFI